MENRLRHPETLEDRYPSPPVEHPLEEREGLENGPHVWPTYQNIIRLWKISDSDARKLLGDMPEETWKTLKETGEYTFSLEQLYRISYLTGIFAGLNILYEGDLPDRWMQLPNTNRLFGAEETGGKTPLAFLIGGDLTNFSILRRLIDSRAAGN